MRATTSGSRHEAERSGDGRRAGAVHGCLCAGRFGALPAASVWLLCPTSVLVDRLWCEQAAVYNVLSKPLADRADVDVLAELVGCMLAVANDLLVHSGGVPGLAHCSTLELLAVGLTAGQARRLRLGLEMGWRVSFPPSLPTHIRALADIAALLPPFP